MSDQIAHAPQQGPTQYDFGHGTPDTWPKGYYVPIADYEALARAGDILAHELLHSDSPGPLDNWWKHRGNLRCHVCYPLTSSDAGERNEG